MPEVGGACPTGNCINLNHSLHPCLQAGVTVILKFPTKDIMPFTDEKKRQLVVALLGSLEVDPSYTNASISLTVVPPTASTAARQLLVEATANRRNLQVREQSDFRAIGL